MTNRTENERETETTEAVESRSARLRTTHDAADVVAESLRPDNTESIRMAVEGDSLTTTIERGTTGGLQSTVDDAVVNLTVADAVIDTVRNYQS